MVATDRTASVVVVGAGPFGLSVSAHLAAAGVDHLVFGEVMRTWNRHMPEGMFLKSEAGASSLSDPGSSSSLERFSAGIGLPYADQGTPLALDTFCDYGAWFARMQQLPVEDVTVERIAARDGGFLVETADGTVNCRSVVLATGIMPFAHVPPPLAGLPADVVSHSSAVSDPAVFAHRDVTIVGGGSSALELAALVNEAGGDAHVLVRGSSVLWGGPPVTDASLYRRIRWPRAALCDSWPCWIYSNAPLLFRRYRLETRRTAIETTFGPAGGWWLKDRVEGIVDVRTGTNVDGIDCVNGRIIVHTTGPDGSVALATDHVVAATGYQPHIDKVAILDQDLRRAIHHTYGYPVLSPRMESSIPGLFVVGSLAAYTFGPAMRFVWGAGFAGTQVTSGVRRRGRRTA